MFIGTWEHPGGHGKPIDDDGNHRYYRWWFDENNDIQITFSVTDGQEFRSVTQWEGLY